jgi:hypothetical protein
MRRAGIVAVTLVAFALAAAASGADLLTAADVEKVAGVSGVKLTEKNPAKGAGGDLNFLGPDGKLLVMVRAYKSGQYEKLKKTFFAGDVKGVGDEAFSAPPGVKQPYVLYLRKGSAGASVTTYLTRDATPKLTMAQLSDLGRVVASRM